MSVSKLFISYSWTTPQHEQWVLDLATQLVENGVDVILDKWHLREGHDANAFMEQMVTDPNVGKVLLVCDKKYKEKADARAGGAGTEAQIISPEIYKKKEQSKYVAIVKEKDHDNKPYLPAYYGSRIYIDLSDDTTYATNFEQLLRWIYDKPRHERPELGAPPGFLSDNPALQLGTTSRWRRAIDAIKAGRDFADGAVAEYLSTFVTGFEKLRINDNSKEFDDAVMESIEAFVPYRNEYIEFLVTVAQYRDTEATRKALHRFLEQILVYSERPEHVKSWRECDFDNFRFILHELFLYTIAVLIRFERFLSARYLLETPYYAPHLYNNRNDAMVQFDVFRRHLKTLEYRNSRKNLRRLSLHADLLKHRCTGLPIELRHLLQADLVLFIRGHDDYRYWWPDTLLYARHETTFEIFARAKSKAYFQDVLALLGFQSKELLVQHLEHLAANRGMPRWDYETVNVKPLMGLESLATLP